MHLVCDIIHCCINFSLVVLVKLVVVVPKTRLDVCNTKKPLREGCTAARELIMLPMLCKKEEEEQGRARGPSWRRTTSTCFGNGPRSDNLEGAPNQMPHDVSMRRICPTSSFLPHSFFACRTYIPQFPSQPRTFFSHSVHSTHPRSFHTHHRQPCPAFHKSCANQLLRQTPSLPLLEPLKTVCVAYICMRT